MDEINIPVMMRQARNAVFDQDYDQAAILYTTLMAHEEMADNFDIKMRHAFCVEKTGHTNQAIKLYQGVADHYRETGEEGAAKSVETTIAALEQAMQEKRAAVQAEKERLRAEAEAEKERIRAAEEAEKARIKAEKIRVAQAEIERIRAEKARAEEERLEKAREEHARAEKIRFEKIRFEKAVAEEARAKRLLAKKGVRHHHTEDEYELFEFTEETEELQVLDLSRLK